MINDYKQNSNFKWLREFHDNDPSAGPDYKKNFLFKFTSPHLWVNPRLRGFMEHMNILMSFMYEQNQIVRNWWTVWNSRWYSKHND